MIPIYQEDNISKIMSARNPKVEPLEIVSNISLVEQDLF